MVGQISAPATGHLEGAVGQRGFLALYTNGDSGDVMPVFDALPVVWSTNHGIASSTILLPVTEIAFATRTAVRGRRFLAAAPSPLLFPPSARAIKATLSPCPPGTRARRHSQEAG